MFIQLLRSLSLNQHIFVSCAIGIRHANILFSVCACRLPAVCVLHLKRFAYGMGGAMKIPKHVAFPPKLSFKQKYLFGALAKQPNGRLRDCVAHFFGLFPMVCPGFVWFS